MTDAFKRALDQRAESGNPLHLWLRDDDATVPSAALDRLLSVTEAAHVPLTLAVIPADTGAALAARLADAVGVSVAVHGWSHHNHAPASEKKQELGAHRPAAQVLGELKRGFAQVSQAYPRQFTPVLVPPWNRISPELMAGLPALGFQALSVFGPEKPAPLRLINTHVDVIDWRAGRVGRAKDVLLGEILTAMAKGMQPIGILTHHLVHDAQVWAFLEHLFTLTTDHPGCRWIGLPQIIALP